MKRPSPTFFKGDQFTLSDEALENYGEEYKGKIFTVTQWYEHDIPVSQIGNDPHGHPGFDPEGSGEQSCLYDSDFEGSLYDWEMEKVPKA